METQKTKESGGGGWYGVSDRALFGLSSGTDKQLFLASERMYRACIYEVAEGDARNYPLFVFLACCLGLGGCHRSYFASIRMTSCALWLEPDAKMEDNPSLLSVPTRKSNQPIRDEGTTLARRRI